MIYIISGNRNCFSYDKNIFTTEHKEDLYIFSNHITTLDFPFEDSLNFSSQRELNIELKWKYSFFIEMKSKIEKIKELLCYFTFTSWNERIERF